MVLEEALEQLRKLMEKSKASSGGSQREREKEITEGGKNDYKEAMKEESQKERERNGDKDVNGREEKKAKQKEREDEGAREKEKEISEEERWKMDIWNEFMKRIEKEMSKTKRTKDRRPNFQEPKAEILLGAGLSFSCLDFFRLLSF